MNPRGLGEAEDGKRGSSRGGITVSKSLSWTDEPTEDRRAATTAGHSRRLHCRKEFEPPSGPSAPGGVSSKAAQSGSGHPDGRRRHGEGRGRLHRPTGCLHVSVGLVVRIVMAVGLARLMVILLFETEPWDPAVYAGVVELILVVGVLASLLPAVRAARMDPVRALQSQ